MTGLARARLRVRLTAASFLLSLVIISGAVIALMAVLQQETAQTITARLQERATALAATVEDRQGQIDVAGADEALFDGTNWVYDATGKRIEGPTSNGLLQPSLTTLSTSREARTLNASPWHLRAIPVKAHHRVIAVVVTGINDRPYAETISSTARAAVVFGLLAVSGVTALTALVLSRSLGPIAVMTDQAAGWSRTRSDGRFALGPPKDEIGRLAAVLDDLLDRVDAALAAERRLTAEIAHELRTPLTLLTGEAQLALMRHDLSDDLRSRFERIEQAADSMARAVTTLLADAAAAAERDTTADAETAIRAVTGALRFHGTISISGTAPLVAVPSAVLERILAPMIDNATRLATTTVHIELAATATAARIQISDDGPGVGDAVRDSLFDPGVSGRDGGTGIGLALARRLARDAGGDVQLIQARPAIFEVRLPLLDPINVR